MLFLPDKSSMRSDRKESNDRKKSNDLTWKHAEGSQGERQKGKAKYTRKRERASNVSHCTGLWPTFPASAKQQGGRFIEQSLSVDGLVGEPDKSLDL